MKFYRLHVPNRVFPKLHFLETHCLEWIEKYPFRMGLFSEQGSESLHAYVRILEIRFHEIPNEEKKMKSVMQKYLYQVSPSLIALFPKIKKRPNVNLNLLEHQAKLLQQQQQQAAH